MIDIEPYSLRTNNIRDVYYKYLNNYLHPSINIKTDNYSDIIISSPREFDLQWDGICPLINKALKEIVENYFLDERIQNIYSLSEQYNSILNMAKGTKYEVGIYRPDFLIEKETMLPKICEMGARYPLNGWMLTHYSQLVLKQLISEFRLPFSIKSQQIDFVDIVKNKFNKDSHITLIHNQEPGTEIYSFLNLLEKDGYSYVQAKPQELKKDRSGNLYINGKRSQQFVFEMDRTELLDFDPEVLASIIKNGVCLNDVRTLILVHDKRVLAVLFNEDIMKDYITEQEYNVLAKYLIPTYDCDNPEVREMVLNSADNWIFKKNSGGRGLDMYVKNSMQANELKEFLDNNSSEYMAQKFVNQELYSLQEKMHLVGVLLFYNDHFFGSGLYRGGSHKIINTNHKGVRIYPNVYQ